MQTTSTSRALKKTAALLLPLITLASTPLSAALYWDLNGPTVGAGAAPAGTWDGATLNWNSDSGGEGAGPGIWTAGESAVFSAGTDATGTFGLTVSGTQTASGLSVEEGTLTLSGGTLSLNASSIVDIANGSTATLSSLLSGGTPATRYTKQGGGTLILGNASNNFTGGFIITGGVVSHNGEASATAGAPSTSGAIPAAPVADYFTLSNNAVLRATRTGNGITALATNKGITLGLGGGTWDEANLDGGNVHIYGGVITGAGQFTKSGPGVLAFTGNHTYTGATNITGGILRLRTAVAPPGTWIPDTSAVTISSGASLDLATFVETVGSIAGSGNIVGSATTTSIFTFGGDNSSTTFSGNIASTTLTPTARPVVKVGSGTLTIEGVEWSNTGSTTINGGSIKYGNAASGLNNSSQIILGAAGNLDMNHINDTVGSVAGAGAITNGGNLTLSGNNSAIATFSGTFSGTAVSRTLTKNGIGIQVLSGTTNFTSADFNAGELRMNSNTALNGAGGPVPINVAATAVANPSQSSGTDGIGVSAGSIDIPNAIALNGGAANLKIYATGSSSGHFNGVISGVGGIVRDDFGAGTVVLNGSNTFQGGVKIFSRNLSVGNKSGFGTGPLTIGDSVVAPANPITITATVDLTGVNAIANPITLNQNLTLAGQNIELTSPIDLGANTRTITAENAAEKAAILSGIISGPGGSLVKAGAGVLDLAANNTYTGDTTITAGTLVLSGSLNGTAKLDISGTLGGSGSITPAALGNINLLAGGKIAPGTSVGNLTAILSGGGEVDLSLGVTSVNSQGLAFELDTPLLSDRFTLSGGALEIGAGVLEFDDFLFSTLSGFAMGDYVLFDGSVPITGSFGPIVSGTLGGLDANLQLADSGNDLVLHVVPEPGSVALLFGGVALLTSRRRRRA
jgi:fibronectin-binding autotransporter adhesin